MEYLQLGMVSKRMVFCWTMLMMLTEKSPGGRQAADAELQEAERILVTEDDPAVLTLTVDLLEGLGYSVARATTAEEALAVLRDDPGIDLLFSDVVMPGGVSGVALAGLARKIRPGLRILLTSGFTGNAVQLGQSTYPILDKPYEAPVLAAKMRELLEAPVRAKPGRSRAKSDRLQA